MRKIINSTFISLDGVTDDPTSWAIFDPDSAQEAVQVMHAPGGALIGRGTAAGGSRKKFPLGHLATAPSANGVVALSYQPAQ